MYSSGPSEARKHLEFLQIGKEPFWTYQSTVIFILSRTSRPSWRKQKKIGFPSLPYTIADPLTGVVRTSLLPSVKENSKIQEKSLVLSTFGSSPSQNHPQHDLLKLWNQEMLKALIIYTGVIFHLLSLSVYYTFISTISIQWQLHIHENTGMMTLVQRHSFLQAFYYHLGDW